MRADIFIPTSNRLDALSQCLDSLEAQTCRDFTVRLAGICPDAQVERLVAGHPGLDLDYFVQSAPGIIGAANEALARARGDVFIRIDDDVVLEPHWLEEVLGTFAANPRAGGVTGPTVMSAEGLASRDLTAFLERFQASRNPVLRFASFLYTQVLYEGRMREPSRLLPSGVFTLGSNYPDCLDLKEPREVENLEACNWSARTHLLRQAGGFDPLFLKGLGDYHETDAALRIRALGYVLVFNPRARLRHNVEMGKVAKARPRPYHRIQNFVLFYFRHFPIRSAAQLGKFALNLAMQNGYYLYKFLSTGSADQLAAPAGTAVALGKVLLGRHREQGLTP
jgi:GT2 family glycosyltransferase